MLIGVVSDSHDHVRLLRRALELFKERGVVAILHAGDFIAPVSAKLVADPALTGGAAVYCIYGNNDGERTGLENMLPQLADGPLCVDLGGVRITMHHFIEWFSADDLARVDVVVIGHSHEIVNETRDGVLYLNPGECCGILTGRPTAAILNTASKTAEIVDLAE